MQPRDFLRLKEIETLKTVPKFNEFLSLPLQKTANCNPAHWNRAIEHERPTGMRGTPNAQLPVGTRAGHKSRHSHTSLRVNTEAHTTILRHTPAGFEIQQGLHRVGVPEVNNKRGV